MNNLMFTGLICIESIMILYYLYIVLFFPIKMKSTIVKKAKQIKIKYKYNDFEQFRIAKWYCRLIITIFAPIAITFLILGLTMLCNIEDKSIGIVCFIIAFFLIFSLLIILYKLPRSYVKIQNGIITYYDGLKKTYDMNLNKISGAYINSNYPRGTVVSLTLNNKFAIAKRLPFNVVIPLHFENSDRIVAIVKSFDDYFHPWFKL